MILPPPAKEDFDFHGEIEVDVENKGFTPSEIKTLAGVPPVEFRVKGARGFSDWVNKIWATDRPPEIQNLKSQFGYQLVPLVTDLVSVAEAEGTPLEGTIRSSSPNYNFYLMRCGVFIEPADREKFEALKFEVRYKGKDASTYAMLPGPQTKTTLELSGAANIGIDAKGEFGFPRVTLPQLGVAVGASADAEVKAKFIVSFHYELKTNVVDCYGSGNRFCRWFMHKGDKLRNDVSFYPVVMTPKSVTEFECEFKAYFKIDHPDWKNAEYFLKPPKTVRVSGGNPRVG
jgi:hypothetical protein